MEHSVGTARACKSDPKIDRQLKKKKKKMTRLILRFWK